MKVLNIVFLYKIKRKIRKFLYNPRKYLNDDKKYLIELGKISLGYKMNLDNPRTFNEKINWYKLHYKNDLMPICADKYLVRGYVKENGIEHILLKNYGVYDNITDISLEDLPEQFVAKVTGDSGGVVLCKNKKDFYRQAKTKFKNIIQDYSFYNKEWPYHYIKNKIIIEELIQTKDGKAPNDYKIFCFNGEPKFLYVATERNIDVKLDFYDLNWNHLPVKQGHLNSRNKIKKPENLKEMLEYAKILSKPFPFVRVDFYNENGKVYFGELTFFSFSGLTPFFPKKYDNIFGEYFDIDKL